MSGQYDNPFANPAPTPTDSFVYSGSASIEPDVDIVIPTASPTPKAKQPAPPRSPVPPTRPTPPVVSGNIGTSTATNGANGNNTELGTGATRAYVEDTLDEPVSVTIVSFHRCSL